MRYLPAVRFLSLFALAGLVFLVDAVAALVVDFALLAAFGFDAARTPGLRGLQLHRSAPDRVPLGGAAAIELELRNRTDRRVVGKITDDLPLTLRRLGPDLLAVEARPFADARITYEARAETRGEAVLGDVHLRLLGPLGLCWTRLKYPRVDRVLVQPGVLEVRRYRLLALRHRLREAGIRNVRFRGETGVFESLREYVRGDDPRIVDWKATARSGSVMVRQFEAERSQFVQIAIDAGRLMTERLGERDRLDHALSAALLLADVASHAGDRVGLLVFSDRIHTFLPPGRHSLSRLSETLAQVEPRLVESNYPAAFSYLARQLRRRSLLVVFTDLIDAGASSALVVHLSRSVRRHLPLVVAVRNPALEVAASSPVRSGAEAFRRAAAEELVQARAAVLTRMERAGVLVADAAPGQSAPAVVNRYLEVKARRLL